MKILVTGVNGQLGYDVVNKLSQLSIECKGVDIDDFDLTDKKQVEDYVSAYNPDAVIHCAAYTAVDKAEDNRELCYNVNVVGTENIFVAAKKLGAKFMYISTDYVFDGKGENYFEPEDTKAPCNYYGETKLGGEKVVEGYNKLFVVRISWVFGKNGNNFIKTMLRLSETRDELSVVADQIGSPTYTFDLARLLCDMIVTDKYGYYHATNEGVCSWADFAEYIFECAGNNVKVNHILTSEYPTRAARPMNSRMSKEKLTENGFDKLPTWQDAVKRYVLELRMNTTEGRY